MLMSTRRKDRTQGVKNGSDLEYEELGQIADNKERVTKNKVMKTYNMLWSHHDDRD